MQVPPASNSKCLRWMAGVRLDAQDQGPDRWDRHAPAAESHAARTAESLVDREYDAASRYLICRRRCIRPVHGCGKSSAHRQARSATVSCMAAPITTARFGLMRRCSLASLSAMYRLRPCTSRTILLPIRLILANFPELPQVACFDTAFHRDHSAVADYYAIPQHFHAEGVRRYGFHGLSYEYIASRLPEVAPEVRRGASLSLIWAAAPPCVRCRAGVALRAPWGLPRSTACPWAPVPVRSTLASALFDRAEKDDRARPCRISSIGSAGLKGLSGISNDVRELQSAAIREPHLHSIISAIGSGFTPACWRRPWAGLTPSCLLLELARTRRPSARASPPDWLVGCGSGCKGQFGPCPAHICRREPCCALHYSDGRRIDDRAPYIGGTVRRKHPMMSDTNTPAVLARSCLGWLTGSTNEHAHEGRRKYDGPRYVFCSACRGCAHSSWVVI